MILQPVPENTSGLITPICKSINSSTFMYILQLPFVPPNAKAVQVSFLIMCWIWQGWLMYWERHITLENKVISSGKKEKSGGCAVKKPQTTPKQKNYPLL